MRQAIKQHSSPVLLNGLMYASGKSANNKKIEEQLLKEQKGYCAYTDEFITRTDAKDVEHFDPTLKNQPGDNYNNWFVVKTQWNKEKSYKWEKFQPVLHPAAADFETRIVYFEGDYLANDITDAHAGNLIKLLKLDDPGLADKRKRYIRRKAAEIAAYGESAASFFTTLINDDPSQVSYSRAIKEEFDFDIWSVL